MSTLEPANKNRALDMAAFFQSNAYPESYAAEHFARLASREILPPRLVYESKGDFWRVRVVERNAPSGKEERATGER